MVWKCPSDSDPAQSVKEVNEWNYTGQSLQEAAKARGDAKKISVVKKSEGEALRKKLLGEALANQLKAIIVGIQSSLEEFQESIPDIIFRYFKVDRRGWEEQHDIHPTWSRSGRGLVGSDPQSHAGGKRGNNHVGLKQEPKGE